MDHPPPHVIPLLGLVVLFLLAWQSARAEDTNPSNDYIDRSLYPKGYGILSSDHLMFPMDMSDWPVEIDSKRQLLVDDYLVASRGGLVREWHEAVKHPGNPVMVGDLPWENNDGGNQIIPLELRRDPETGVFRMWYSVRLRYTEPGGVSVRFPTLYAESDDGVAWRKPNLGVLEYEGSTENNFVIHGGRIVGLFENAADPDKRYTALVLLEPEYVEREGYYLYTSPDGLHWTGDRTRCLIPSLQSYTMPQNGIGDTTIFRYDPVLGQYVCDAKFVLPGKMRCRGQCESDDLIHWTRPHFTLYPDEHDGPDAQVYGNISFVYESMWLGLCRVMHTDRTGWKQVEVQLSVSRDGRHWSRPADRRQFIALGEPESWEPDYTDPAHCAPILVGDEWWFFYRGSRHPERDKKEHPKGYEMAMGLATVVRDRFASLNGGDEPGVLITRSLTFSGQALFVNAQVAQGGGIKAAVLDVKGEPVDGYGFEDSVPLEGDTTAARMVWSGGRSTVPQVDSHVRLAFELTNAKLYAFWIE